VTQLVETDIMHNAADQPRTTRCRTLLRTGRGQHANASPRREAAARPLRLESASRLAGAAPLSGLDAAQIYRSTIRPMGALALLDSLLHVEVDRAVSGRGPIWLPRTLTTTLRLSRWADR
jgi:hypothetical protein